MSDRYTLSLFDELEPEPEVPVPPAADIPAPHAPDPPDLAEPGEIPPADHPERLRAVDVAHSVIVQAPAGSGKTDLLTRRYLKLLAEAEIEQPEQILAITFTRAATAEMRARVLADLHEAATAPLDQSGERLALARRALARAEQRGWNLLQQPERMQIETIDSLCMRIAHGQPLLARLGGRFTPVDNAEDLYREAAHRTLRALGSSDTTLSNALEHLLQLRDNNLPDCESLLAGMLRTRDQWEHVFPLSETIDWDDARYVLEAPFRAEVSRVLSTAAQLLASESTLVTELLAVANYACSHRQDNDIRALAELTDLPQSTSLEHWQCVSKFLLKKSDPGDWYQRFTALHGLPAGKANTVEREWNNRGNAVLERARRIDGLLEALQAIRSLPAPRYDDAQWTTLRNLFITLRHAVAQLRVLFAERNQVDFTQLSSAALHVLENLEQGQRWSEQIRHLLIDEFQDTSRRQHQLVSALLAAWSPNDGRTCFLVGDPMQSIYIFRQAEVELFGEVRRNGIRLASELHHPCQPVELRVNFRSHAALVDELNNVFPPVFAPRNPGETPAVEFVASEAALKADETIDPAVEGAALRVHPQVLDCRDEENRANRKRQLQQQEAEEIISILDRHMPQIQAARLAGKEYRVAVLVRNRSHLAALLPLLRSRQIAFRAVDIESLAERQELLDLMSLVRALLHPMDRIAWLALLRAPWCGLELHELHILTGSDDPASRQLPMLDLIERNLPLLDETARRRVTRLVAVLRRAQQTRLNAAEVPSFAAWIERTWRALGGHLCLNAAERENAQVFFTLLDGLDAGGTQAMSGALLEQLQSLYASPDPAVSERCGVQLMTIHSAKGLGFDVVILPGLERKSPHDGHPLIVSLQRSNPHTGREEFLIAPIGAKGEAAHSVYTWIRRLSQKRFDEERKRLFYVACTRARRQLHLIGTAEVNDKGLSAPSGSLLNTAWPALKPWFEETLPQQPAATVVQFPARSQPQPLVLDLAAGQEPGPSLRRLPLALDLEPVGTNVVAARAAPPVQQTDIARPEGSRLSRILGSVLHLLLQRLGPQIAAGSLDPAMLRPRIAALLRPYGLDDPRAAATARDLEQMIAACAADPVARWILADHPQARSEVSWTGWFDGALRTLRADRIFTAGGRPLEPHTADEECFWIVDYKTSAGDRDDPEEFLANQREIYGPQLQAYAEAVRSAESAGTPIRLGLYYPRLNGSKRLDWWEY